MKLSPHFHNVLNKYHVLYLCNSYHVISHIAYNSKLFNPIVKSPSPFSPLQFSKYRQSNPIPPTFSVFGIQLAQNVPATYPSPSEIYINSSRGYFTCKNGQICVAFKLKMMLCINDKLLKLNLADEKVKED